MRVSLGSILWRWWWKRFHPVSRVGWGAVTSGRSRSTSQTVIGLLLVGAGVVMRRRGRRQVLYRGSIEPGTTARITLHKTWAEGRSNVDA